jgi:hypothetical protein
MRCNNIICHIGDPLAMVLLRPSLFFALERRRLNVERRIYREVTEIFLNRHLEE